MTSDVGRISAGLGKDARKALVPILLGIGLLVVDVVAVVVRARAAGADSTTDTLLSGDRQGYVAICLSLPPEDAQTRVLTYQLRDGEGGALAGWKG